MAEAGDRFRSAFSVQRSTFSVQRSAFSVQRVQGKSHVFRLGKQAIKTIIKNSLGILGARANAECLEDRLGIMLGDGKTAFGRRRSAEAANWEA